YYYTVVALPGTAGAAYALTTATTFAQVKAQAFRANATRTPRSNKAAKGGQFTIKNGFRASRATGTAQTAIKTARAAHPLSALSGACTVALPHTLASGTETNFGCGSGASIVELLINPSSPTIAASSAT